MGVLKQGEPIQASSEQVDRMMPHVPVPGIGRLVFGSNARVRADRTRKVLGCEPKGSKFLDLLKGDLIRAAKSLPSL